MLNYTIVGVGSAAGGTARYWASGSIAYRFGQSFPWGILFANVTGSFILGFFATVTATERRWLVGPRGRNFFMTGCCGSDTTFSSFSLQTLNLAQENEWLCAGGNAVSKLFPCLIAVRAGPVLALSLNPTKGS